MKRIVFLLNRQPDQAVKTEYIEYLAESGISALYLKAEEGNSLEDGATDEGFLPEYEDIVCTDSQYEYERLLLHGENAVIALNSLEDADKFKGAQYLLLDSQDTEAEYYKKVWLRFRSLPWLIRETERLIIRETTEEDVDRFVELYKNPSMVKYTEALYEDIEEERKYAREYIEKIYKVQGFGIWTIIEKESNQIIGRGGIVAREGFDGVEIGYSIGVEYQNRGYATETVKACLEICEELELKPVRVLTMSENLPSIRVLEKCGFEKRGRVSLNYVDYDEYLWQG